MLAGDLFHLGRTISYFVGKIIQSFTSQPPLIWKMQGRKILCGKFQIAEQKLLPKTSLSSLLSHQLIIRHIPVGPRAHAPALRVAHGANGRFRLLSQLKGTWAGDLVCGIISRREALCQRSKGIQDHSMN